MSAQIYFPALSFNRDDAADNNISHFWLIGVLKRFYLDDLRDFVHNSSLRCVDTVCLDKRAVTSYEILSLGYQVTGNDKSEAFLLFH